MLQIQRKKKLYYNIIIGIVRTIEPTGKTYQRIFSKQSTREGTLNPIGRLV